MLSFFKLSKNINSPGKTALSVCADLPGEGRFHTFSFMSCERAALGLISGRDVSFSGGGTSIGQAQGSTTDLIWIVFMIIPTLNLEDKLAHLQTRIALACHL